ncbi:nickel pincer cofactor biosynthesis protein LarC [Geomesophilobacter sediminis]|uniref:Putative nickel insertion protein n=1 Tax=Geomesophilobacter sediminis TaxID=2798584 RepID=A0A8J7LYV4_9BACT|nr:nickel pincer cofactor biosynthesis protein LarC [Geomesophilobacter sediminis]MBJ6725611.1 nickel pincer cofactor biosynthesis protein LarC [Geomesophilobacter sediminis]
MKTLYLDCFAGIAGDMTVAGLIDLGLPLDVLRDGLAPLPYTGYRLESERTERHHIGGSSFRVILEQEDQPHRHYGDIARTIEDSQLPDGVKARAGRIFLRLAEAEAKVHGVDLERVHFHEVGAIDSIVDIVGTAIGLEYLGVEQVKASGLPYGSGFVKTAHGLLPVPAPATAELMQGIPVTGPIGPGERVTPTGAAIVAALAEGFGPPSGFTVEKIGYGAGEKDFPDLPNLLRLVLGMPTAETEQVLVLETHIDDMPAEVFGYVMERLLAAGALDVALAPIQMKKNRPATKLTVIAREADLDRLSGIIFAESTAIGLRHYPARRIVIPRRVEERETPLGKMRVKVLGNGRVAPEYEECRRIALERGIPLLEVYRIVGRENG